MSIFTEPWDLKIEEFENQIRELKKEYRDLFRRTGNIIASHNSLTKLEIKFLAVMDKVIETKRDLTYDFEKDRQRRTYQWPHDAYSNLKWKLEQNIILTAEYSAEIRTRRSGNMLRNVNTLEFRPRSRSRSRTKPRAANDHLIKDHMKVLQKSRRFNSKSRKRRQKGRNSIKSRRRRKT